VPMDSPKGPGPQSSPITEPTFRPTVWSCSKSNNRIRGGKLLRSSRFAALRHGPYFEWTYKENGKTVNVRLTAEAAPIFQNAAKQYRALKSNLARLEKLSRLAITRLAKEVASMPRS